MRPETSDPANQRPARLTDLEQGLVSVRSAARRLLTLQGLARVLTVIALTAISLALLDFVLRTPAGFRAVLWIGGVVGVAWLTRRWVWPALQFKPSLTEIALRVERTTEAEHAGLRGTLAAALDLARTDRPALDADESTLRAGVIESARASLAGFRLAPAVLAGASVRRTLLLALAALVPVAVAGLLTPKLARIGFERVLTPWTGAEWPKRTAVADATGLRAHPIGSAIPLRAILLETDRRLGRTDVWANYRLVRGAGEKTETEPVKRVLLTSQMRVASAHVTKKRKGLDTAEAEPVTGEPFERLLDPAGLVPSIAETPAGAGSQTPAFAIEYWFETDDDATEPARVALVEPPAVNSATVEIIPPAYAAQPAGFAFGTRDLGPGRDERANVAPVLGRSRITLDLAINKPLAVPPSAATLFSAGTAPSDALIESTDTGKSSAGSTASARWRVSWTANDSVRLPVVLTDEYGIRGALESTYQFTVVADQPASATVLDPSQDESVIATATIGIVGEARDDVGLAWASLELEQAAPPGGSAGAPAEGSGKRTQLVKSDPTAPGAVAPLVNKVNATLQLSTLNLKPRDELWITALAQDNYAHEGKPHEPTRSPTRRLRIIAESELIEQIRGELNGVRQAAIRLDQDQAEAMKRIENGAATGDVKTAQEGITQRVLPQEDTVKRQAARAERNGLNDRALEGMLSDAQQSLEQAAQRSAEAAAALEKRERSADEPTPAEKESLAKAQRQVRDQLGQLISMLDRGQDGWTSRRELQRLLDEQNRLQAQTKALGAQTAGKAASELTPQQRAQLDQIAQEQQDQSARSAAALADLAKRGDQLAKADPALAQAMKEAAKKGQESRLADAQRDAAEQVKQNQTSSANQNQQKAAQSLQDMLDELDNTEKNRDQALRRQIEEIIEALDALIAQQTAELRTLADAAARGPLAGVDKGMIALHGSTLAVTERVRSGFRELAEVADLLDGAAEAQTTSITLLRAAHPEAAEVDQAERISLDRLKKARELAEKIQSEAEKRDQERQRAELRKAYRDALERQVALHADTLPILGQPLDRRQRAAARGLGERQLAIKTDLHEVLAKAEGLADFKVFDFAHRRLDQATGRAAETLREGNATAAVGTDQKAAIRILQALVEALKENQNKDFKDSPNSNGDGGQSGGQQPIIPPIAELKLLKLMQQEAADLTRAVVEAQGTNTPAPATLEEVGALQLELFKRAEELIEKQQNGPGGSPEGDSATPPGFNSVDAFDAAAPPADKPANSEPTTQSKKDRPAEAPPSDRPPADKPETDDPLPSLDELLGLPKDHKPADGTGDPKDPTRDELDRKLAPAEAAAEFEQTVALMKQAASRLGESRDPGVATQRLQDDIIRRLDQIISAAERNQQQSQSKSKSQQQQQKQQPQQQRQQSQTNKGENKSQVDPPARQDGPLSPPKPAASAAWGNLPEHVRESLMQGLGDRFSSLYQSMTESYYKRLAEEPKPGAPR